MGFKGSRKSTPYAAQMAAEDAGPKKTWGLTKRELEISRLAACGLANSEIADQLFVSATTRELAPGRADVTPRTNPDVIRKSGAPSPSTSPTPTASNPSVSPATRERRCTRSGAPAR